MKLLERLRDLAHEQNIEPCNELDYHVVSLDYESIEYESAEGAISDPLLDTDRSFHTVDGLRRRIPDVHEDIPPEGYAISEQHAGFDLE